MEGTPGESRKRRSLSILRQSKNNMAISQGRTQEKCAVP